MKARYIVIGGCLALLVLVCLAATTVTPGLPISQYPNNGFPNSNALFVMARPGITNENISFGQLAFRVTNGFSGFASTNQLNNATNGLAHTNVVKQFASNLVVVLSGTNTLVQLTSTNGTNFYKVNSAGGAGVSGSTNFLNLSVQAAKLPATNYPGIDGGNQNWEVLYYHTNAENAVANLSAVWQFVVPPDYATNSGKLHVQHTLLATNGPNSSNVVFTVDCVRSHSGDGVNLHTSTFGSQVSGTNTWAQSSTIVNAQADLVINLDTNLMWQAGDLVIMRLTRNLTNDTYRNTAVGLVGLQLEYTRQ